METLIVHENFVGIQNKFALYLPSFPATSSRRRRSWRQSTSHPKINFIVNFTIFYNKTLQLLNYNKYEFATFKKNELGFAELNENLIFT